MTRRKFVKFAGTALAAAAVPGLFEFAPAEAAAGSAVFGGITPNDKFYITSYGDTPKIDASAWRLKIHGLVENPVELDYAAIRQLPAIKEVLTLECIGNPPGGWLISNAEWAGPKLRPILDRARIQPKAVYAAMRAADGYYTGIPVDELLRAENFLPYLMNGVPLPPAHGYPLRIFIPGKYGMKQPKWITEINFVDHEFTGYLEARGWSNSAWRKVNSGFFAPRPAAGLLSFVAPAPTVKTPAYIWGWALAGPSGIKRVEISTDGGKMWRDAGVAENRSPYIWTVWKYRFAPKTGGSYDIRVRATSGDGITQPVHGPQEGAGSSSQPTLQINATPS
ncbi:MAG: molybdopterin-dependent oxidoreductase [Candidatus Binataceae bacterium]